MTAIVTGAGTGIGAAIARELGRRGHRVAVTDLDEESARRVAAEIEGAEAFQLDVTDRASIEAVCDAACRSLGPLEVWAANAGVSTMSRFVDITEDEYDFNMTVNAKGVFLCGQVAARRLIEQGKGGAIVNTASTAGKWGAAPFLAHYVASKFAVIGITQAMAAELGPYRIRVNCVCPGFVTTSMQERELAWESELRGTSIDEVRELWVSSTPLGRLELPEDVALAVAFLASEDARFITGEALAVNGGTFMD